MHIDMHAGMRGLSSGESSQTWLRHSHRNAQHCIWLQSFGQRCTVGFSAGTNPPGFHPPSPGLLLPSAGDEAASTGGMLIASGSGEVPPAPPVLDPPLPPWGEPSPPVVLDPPVPPVATAPPLPPDPPTGVGTPLPPVAVVVPMPPVPPADPGSTAPFLGELLLQPGPARARATAQTKHPRRTVIPIVAYIAPKVVKKRFPGG